ncbi:phosphatase PAP2 family protein [Lacrimispora sp.]|uniref:phosphatase PAP2 family protein n=1 Tax=Lacrimispora sp. TaxID=2719234 RepID=UPI0028B24EB3|nr:phosphatase PAP2 family protein [Lacrimispora sp.]
MAGTEFGILYFLQSLHTPWLDVLMKEITSLGDHGMFWILTGVVLLCFKKTRLMGLCVILSLAAGLLIGNTFLKNMIARERPCWIDNSVPLLINNPRDYSFPSGHTLASFEGAVSIWLYNRKWGTAALILAALIGFSRMYLFVHFPSDVLGGLVLGILIAVLVHFIVERGKISKKNTCFPGNL